MIPDVISELFRRLADVERRLNNVVRPARVTRVLPDKGLARVAYALDENDQDVESIDVPWVERAGHIRTWEPPTIGEQVILVSMGGEIGDSSWIMRGGFTNQFPQPHDKEKEYKVQVGNSYVLHKENELEMKIDGLVKVRAARVEFEQNGGGGGPAPEL